MKRNILYYIFAITAALFVGSCSDDDSFTTSPTNILTFSSDTIKLDTVFSTVPSSTRSFWVFNRSGDGLRCTNVRLENGNQVGFRVNVDGEYLSPTNGYQVNDIEVRNKDSIRVFVELTSTMNYADRPTRIEDNLVFTLESGVTQRVNLNAYSWDALLMKNTTIDSDSTLSGSKPIVIYGDLKVAEGATLTVAAGTTLYFHSDASIDVDGRLVCQGTPEANVVLRGDRLDNMFDYLPYNYMSGQWNGIHLGETSYDNVLEYTDLHSAFNGIVADSASVERNKLTMTGCTVHNCQGYGVKMVNSLSAFSNCQFSNTLNDCLLVDGGSADINNCTLAQFYPYDSNRGAALRFSATTHPLLSLLCRNTLITGYADDEMMGEPSEDGTATFNFDFAHCIIRTPKVETEDSVHFVSVTFEEYEDTVKAGRKHFAKIDTDNLRYDFRLDSISPAIDAADPATALPTDRMGLRRDDKPDIGAYEYHKQD